MTALPLTPHPAGSVPVDRHRLRRVAVVGTPGAGKQLVAARLAASLDVPHIAIGDLLRDEVRASTALGQEIEATMARGLLLHDEVVLRVLAQHLAIADTFDGFVIDGFPRTHTQAELFAGYLRPDHLDLVVEVTLPKAETIDRLARRGLCGRCGTPHPLERFEATRPCTLCDGRVQRRADDQPNAVEQRLAQYRGQTRYMLEAFAAQERAISVEAGITTDDTWARVRSRLSATTPAPVR